MPLESLAALGRGQPLDLLLVVEAGYVLPHALWAERESPNPHPGPAAAAASVARLLQRGLLVGDQIGVVSADAAHVEVVPHRAVISDDAEARGRGWGKEGRRRRVFFFQIQKRWRKRKLPAGLTMAVALDPFSIC